MKAYKIELLVIDFDDLGIMLIKEELENTRYGNDCISPEIINFQGVDIGEWHDEHPLNQGNYRKGFTDEYERLFGKDNLNKEMLEALKEAYDYLFPKQGSCLKPLPSFAETKAIKMKLQSIIAKAEAQ